jgi:hypothetical protein
MLDEQTLAFAPIRLFVCYAGAAFIRVRDVAMSISETARFAAAIHRKLRAIAAVLSDPAATEHERTNAEALKIRLEEQLKQEAKPQGTWTDIMFRLGRTAREIKQSASPPSPKGDWTDYAFRLGRTLRKGLKKWSDKT